MVDFADLASNRKSAVAKVTNALFAALSPLPVAAEKSAAQKTAGAVAGVSSEPNTEVSHDQNGESKR